jgi:hypothetical protein
VENLQCPANSWWAGKDVEGPMWKGGWTTCQGEGLLPKLGRLREEERLRMKEKEREEENRGERKKEREREKERERDMNKPVLRVG